MPDFRTDLAIESHDMYKEKADSVDNLSGIFCDVFDEDGISVTKVVIENKEGSKKLGKPQGTYITIECEELKYQDLSKAKKTIEILSRELANMLKIDTGSSVLVIGLGNHSITPDSLGPQVVAHIKVNSHAGFGRGENPDGKNHRAIFALSPGVLGTTGMETSQIVRGVVGQIHPSAVIVVDALAARKVSRIHTTIQIADTGIVPGSGVGNNRQELSQKTLGVPVIAVGVPMVVDCATIAIEAIASLSQETAHLKNGDLLTAVQDMSPAHLHEIVTEILSPHGLDMIVTPREIDQIVHDMAHIVASGINAALELSVTSRK